MTRKARYVLDTNLSISRLLVPSSIPAQAAQKAIAQGEVLFSEATLRELVEVLSRRKFDRYVSIEDRRDFFTKIDSIASRVSILRRIEACRDPKDNAVLEVAVNGGADAIITGDQDLLVLHPFSGIQVLSPRQFLDED